MFFGVQKSTKNVANHNNMSLLHHSASANVFQKAIEIYFHGKNNIFYIYLFLIYCLDYIQFINKFYSERA